MAKELLEGNAAIAEAAIRAGVEAFFGYPITPQTEVLEHFSKRLPEEGRVFLQAESEVAAINMVYGAASAGKRAMTSSSSPGVSLKQEGLSYIAGSELPCVVVNVQRGGPGLGNTMLAIGLMGIPTYVRLTRSRAIQLRRAWYVRAAYVVGCTDARILVRHMLPNLLPTIAALATLDVAWAILNAATLSFLGLGAQPPTPEWGAMINEGRGFLRQAPWMVLAPGAMLTLTVLAIHLLGDGLGDVLDPRAK